MTQNKAFRGLIDFEKCRLLINIMAIFFLIENRLSHTKKCMVPFLWQVFIGMGGRGGYNNCKYIPTLSYQPKLVSSWFTLFAYTVMEILFQMLCTFIIVFSY